MPNIAWVSTAGGPEILYFPRLHYEDDAEGIYEGILRVHLPTVILHLGACSSPAACEKMEADELRAANCPAKFLAKLVRMLVVDLNGGTVAPGEGTGEVAGEIPGDEGKCTKFTSSSPQRVVAVGRTTADEDPPPNRITVGTLAFDPTTGFRASRSPTASESPPTSRSPRSRKSLKEVSKNPSSRNPTFARCVAEPLRVASVRPLQSPAAEADHPSSAVLPQLTQNPPRRLLVLFASTDMVYNGALDDHQTALRCPSGYTELQPAASPATSPFLLHGEVERVGEQQARENREDRLRGFVLEARKMEIVGDLDWQHVQRLEERELEERKERLRRPPPRPWVRYTDKQGGFFFVNEDTKEVRWDHPLQNNSSTGDGPRTKNDDVAVLLGEDVLLGENSELSSPYPYGCRIPDDALASQEVIYSIPDEDWETKLRPSMLKRKSTILTKKEEQPTKPTFPSYDEDGRLVENGRVGQMQMMMKNPKTPEPTMTFPNSFLREQAHAKIADLDQPMKKPFYAVTK